MNKCGDTLKAHIKIKDRILGTQYKMLSPSAVPIQYVILAKEFCTQSIGRTKCTKEIVTHQNKHFLKLLFLFNNESDGEVGQQEHESVLQYRWR